MEERFDRVDQEIGHVNERLDGVDQHLDRIDERLDGVDQRLDRIDGRLDRVDQRLDHLEGGQNALRADLNTSVARLDGRIEVLDRHMHVLHEDVIARIAAIPDIAHMLRAEMARGFADLTEMIGRRLDPLEIAVRHHSVDIEQLKQARG